MLLFHRVLSSSRFTLLDSILIEISIVLCVTSLAFDIWRWFRCIKTDQRTYDDCVNDIRAMNTYNSYFIAAIIIFFGLVADKGAHSLPISALIMFLASFLCAASAMFFFPIQKTASSATNPAVRKRWLLVLIPSQWTIVLFTCGLLDVAITLLLQGKSIEETAAG